MLDHPHRDLGPYADEPASPLVDAGAVSGMPEADGFGRSYDVPYDGNAKRGLMDRAADELASWFAHRDGHH
ncbi:hypothetical protein [Falsirhodobacter sp. 20TX0035]|uniref:hypothetical protein n=1 Tax=Falsirhodobacter sp. 20TX0035 TaxID=3022019 RepID=UPI00232C394A|nr:hypothetical protein [Falsirhodobacter sp. 20TX0035]MDB6452207.1 hypothetical protein [Falsirhodobacter sp. 20TX0035]